MADRSIKLTALEAEAIKFMVDPQKTAVPFTADEAVGVVRYMMIREGIYVIPDAPPLAVDSRPTPDRAIGD